MTVLLFLGVAVANILVLVLSGASFDCRVKPHEEYDSCPPVCPSENCSEIFETCPRISINVPCKPRCRCIKDYRRRLDGICVPQGQCPGICPTDESYSGCIQGECRALNCTQRDQSLPCPRVRPEFCLKGCVCEKGYLREENGTCIREDQCEIYDDNEDDDDDWLM